MLYQCILSVLLVITYKEKEIEDFCDVRTYVHAYPNSYFPLIASYVLVKKLLECYTYVHEIKHEVKLSALLAWRQAECFILCVTQARLLLLF